MESLITLTAWLVNYSLAEVADLGRNLLLTNKNYMTVLLLKIVVANKQ